jgi:2,5-dioxopentanoate dehydrogenase
VLSVSGKNSIGYEDSAQGDLIFHAFDSAKNKEIPTPFIQAVPAEIEQAVRKAAYAFTVYSELPAPSRGAFLHAVAAELRNVPSELIHWFCRETGLSEARAQRELERSCFQFESYADAVTNGYAIEPKIDLPTEEQRVAGRPDLRKMNVPLGPVVVFGSSNFPFAYSTVGGDVAAALAAGCPVIVKAHPMHPHTSELAARIILSVAQRFGMPDGVFSHLHASDYTVGEALVIHPDVKAVGFTGSIKGGMALHRLAESRKEPIPVYAEMGSSNPIVFTTAALSQRSEAIAREVAASIATDAGQFCTSPGLLFVSASEIADSFMEQLTKELSGIALQPMLHPGIFKQYKQQAELQIDGAEVLLDGQRSDTHIRPSLIRVSGEQFLAEPVRQEEVFGSFATLVVCEDDSELKTCLSTLNGQLTASIYLQEEEMSGDWVLALRRFAGRIIANGVPTGVTVTLAMEHGGPFPSSNHPCTSAVGPDAVKRFLRPVSFQNCPDQLLPEALKRTNPLGILRFVNGFLSAECC